MLRLAIWSRCFGGVNHDILHPSATSFKRLNLSPNAKARPLNGRVIVQLDRAYQANSQVTSKTIAAENQTMAVEIVTLTSSSRFRSAR